MPTKTSQKELEKRIQEMTDIVLPRLNKGGQFFELKEGSLRNGTYIAFIHGPAGGILLSPTRYEDTDYYNAEEAVKRQLEKKGVKEYSRATLFYKDGRDAFRHISQDEDYHKAINGNEKELARIGVFCASTKIRDIITKLSPEEKKQYHENIEAGRWNRTIALSSQEAKARERNIRDIENPIIQYVQTKSPRKEEGVITYQFNKAILSFSEDVNKERYTPEMYAIISDSTIMSDTIHLEKGVLFEGSKERK